MTSRLFYAWLPETATADDKARGKVVIASIRSASVTVHTVAGGYGINVDVTGMNLVASEEAVNNVAARLYHAGFTVGRRAPSAPPVTPVSPPPVVRAQPMVPSPPKVVRTTSVEPPRVPAAKAVGSSPQPTTPATPPPNNAQVARVLEFLRTTVVAEPTLALLSSRLMLGKGVVRRYLQVLIDHGLVEELAERTYRLTAAGRQQS